MILNFSHLIDFSLNFLLFDLQFLLFFSDIVKFWLNAIPIQLERLEWPQLIYSRLLVLKLCQQSLVYIFKAADLGHLVVKLRLVLFFELLLVFEHLDEMFVSLLELAILNIELRVLVLFLLECDSKCVDLCVHTLCIILKILDSLLILLELLDVCVFSLL